LRLDQLAADGSVVRRVAVPYEPPSEGSAVAAEGGYVVQRGNSLWLIARQVYGQGTRYTAIYGANRPQIQDPNKIYPGQHFKLPGL
jgi:nucleoid-associated protein YgaU